MTELFDDMSDADLGALTRTLLPLFDPFDPKHATGVNYMAGTAATVALVRLARMMDSDHLAVDVRGTSIGTEKVGDWRLELNKVGVEPRYPAPPILLGGKLRPGKLHDAVDCFETLTVFTVTGEDLDYKPAPFSTKQKIWRFLRGLPPM